MALSAAQRDYLPAALDIGTCTDRSPSVYKLCFGKPEKATRRKCGDTLPHAQVISVFPGPEEPAEVLPAKAKGIANAFFEGYSVKIVTLPDTTYLSTSNRRKLERFSKNQDPLFDNIVHLSIFLNRIDKKNTKTTENYTHSYKPNLIEWM
jgi:hypothetical protein